MPSDDGGAAPASNPWYSFFFCCAPTVPDAYEDPDYDKLEFKDGVLPMYAQRGGNGRRRSVQDALSLSTRSSLIDDGAAMPPALVIDCGENMLRLGLAGDAAPLARVPALFGALNSSFEGAGENEVFYGDGALKRADLLADGGARPVRGCAAVDWDAVGRVVLHGCCEAALRHDARCEARTSAAAARAALDATDGGDADGNANRGSVGGAEPRVIQAAAAAVPAGQPIVMVEPFGLSAEAREAGVQLAFETLGVS